jgi:hypothetical protein
MDKTNHGQDKPWTRQTLDTTNPGQEKTLGRQTLDKTNPGQDKSRTWQTLDNTNPGQTNPGQNKPWTRKILRKLAKFHEIFVFAKISAKYCKELLSKLTFT